MNLVDASDTTSIEDDTLQAGMHSLWRQFKGQKVKVWHMGGGERKYLEKNTWGQLS